MNCVFTSPASLRPTFSSVNLGDVFKHGENFYIKTGVGGAVKNAFNVVNHSTMSFNGNENVTVYDHTLSILSPRP